MKVTVEVDCTPEETGGNGEIAAAHGSAVEASTPEALLKAWMLMAPDQMQQALAKLFGAFGGSKAGDMG